MIHGIHDAFLVLGVLTILSTLVFRELKSGDGEVSAGKKLLTASDRYGFCVNQYNCFTLAPPFFMGGGFSLPQAA